MLSDEFLNQIFQNNQNKVEANISEEYHNRIKSIQIEDKEERENIKLGIISELYYKEGFKDGVDFVMNYIKKLK